MSQNPFEALVDQRQYTKANSDPSKTEKNKAKKARKRARKRAIKKKLSESQRTIGQHQPKRFYKKETRNQNRSPVPQSNTQTDRNAEKPLNEQMNAPDDKKDENEKNTGKTIENQTPVPKPEVLPASIPREESVPKQQSVKENNAPKKQSSSLLNS